MNPTCLPSSKPADIAAYLTHAAGPIESATAQVADERLAAGEALFENLGCLHCHRFTLPGDEDKFARLSLAFAARKYRSGALAEYLTHPQADHPRSRMPDFQLSAREAGQLADYIACQAKGEIAPAEDPSTPDAARGKQLVECHGSPPAIRSTA